MASCQGGTMRLKPQYENMSLIVYDNDDSKSSKVKVRKVKEGAALFDKMTRRAK